MGKGREPHPRKAKSARPKEKGRAGDAAKFREQLGLLSLRIVEVTADGNCFFRGIAEQLEGNEHNHQHFREQTVNYLEAHRDKFEPFVEDDVPFDEYCKTMREDGTWAGNMELQAVSLMTSSNICIHRLMFPRWHIKNFDDPSTRTLHLSYHDGEHYNSVRRNDDDGKGAALPIFIEADANAGARAPGKDKDKKQENGATYDESAVKIVRASTGCTDSAHVLQVLRDVHGDTQAAIEFLIAELNCAEEPAAGAATPEMVSDLPDEGSLTKSEECVPDEILGDERTVDAIDDVKQENCVEEAEGVNAEADSSETTKPETLLKGEAGFQYKPQGVSRNKPCPCGSKKKYKTCCGAIRCRAAASTDLETSHPELTNKARKERLRSAKVVAQSPNAARRRSNLGSTSYGVVDMGSLCI